MSLERVHDRPVIGTEVALESIKSPPRQPLHGISLEANMMSVDSIEMILQRTPQAVIPVVDRRKDERVTHDKTALLPGTIDMVVVVIVLCANLLLILYRCIVVDLSLIHI